MRILPSIVLLALACSAPDRAVPTPPGVPTASAAPPRLVVAVVLDQLPSHALLRYLPHLDEDGALRTAARRGVFAERVRFSYAGTNTAPGHAAIHTGAPPAVSGVTTNGPWDGARQREVSVVDDGVHAVFGNPNQFASPAVLDAETVADRLVAATEGAAKVVSLSFKARAAVVSGGAKPTAVSWYDTSIPGFTTSSYYAEAMPSWLAAFGAAHPPLEMAGVWEAEDPELYQRLLGDDGAAGEADWQELGTVFPHRLGDAPAPHEAVLVAPASADHLLALARAGIAAHELGGDAVPDLLAISISSTDYTGHTYGPDSWEYLDNLRRVDRALGAFLRQLEAETEIAVLITSDHGGAPLPERTGVGGRIVREEVAATLDAAVDAALGAGDWVQSYIPPFVYLTTAGEARRDEVVPLLVERATAIEGVHGLYDPREARGWRDGDDSLQRAIGLSVTDDDDALFLVPAEHHFPDPERARGHGSHHGSPWDYDREVPVWFYGPGVETARHRDTLDQSRVAATLARLLGIDPPAAADPRPLPGAPASAR